MCIPQERGGAGSERGGESDQEREKGKILYSGIMSYFFLNEKQSLL